MIMVGQRFQGKVVIVTGSSTGIGREAVKLFAEEGAKVVYAGRSTKSLQETKELLLSTGAKEEDILEAQGDLVSEEVQDKLITETVNKFGKIDILVNNAGAGNPDLTKTSGFETDMDAYDYVMNLNLRSVTRLTRLAMPYLIKSKGEVVMVSSIAGLPFAFPPLPYYSMTKAALSQLTRALAATYAPEGVRINSVNPGIITTDIMKKQGATDEDVVKLEKSLCSSASSTPLGRAGTSREIAESIAFLADRKTSSYIVGHCLVVDGGSTLMTPVLSNYKSDY